MPCSTLPLSLLLCLAPPLGEVAPLEVQRPKVEAVSAVLPEVVPKPVPTSTPAPEPMPTTETNSLPPYAVSAEERRELELLRAAMQHPHVRDLAWKAELERRDDLRATRSGQGAALAGMIGGFATSAAGIGLGYSMGPAGWTLMGVGAAGGFAGMIGVIATARKLEREKKKFLMLPVAGEMSGVVVVGRF